MTFAAPAANPVVPPPPAKVPTPPKAPKAPKMGHDSKEDA